MLGVSKEEQRYRDFIGELYPKINYEMVKQMLGRDNAGKELDEEKEYKPRLKEYNAQVVLVKLCEDYLAKSSITKHHHDFVETLKIFARIKFVSCVVRDIEDYVINNQRKTTFFWSDFFEKEGTFVGLMRAFFHRFQDLNLLETWSNSKLLFDGQQPQPHVASAAAPKSAAASAAVYVAGSPATGAGAADAKKTSLTDCMLPQYPCPPPGQASTNACSKK